MITITRFERRGRSAPVIDTTDASSISDLNALIKKQRDNIGQPRFWSFSEWDGAHGKGKHLNSTAIVLEYDSNITCPSLKGLDSLGICTLAVETENGFALIFPLSDDIDAARYTRLAAVLAEIIGCEGLVDGSAACTFLFTPIDTAKFLWLIKGDPISSKFIFETKDMKADATKWYATKADPIKIELPKEFSEIHNAIAMEQQHARASYVNLASEIDSVRAEAVLRQRANFDDLFERMDESFHTLSNGITALHKTVKEYIKGQGGQSDQEGR